MKQSTTPISSKETKSRTMKRDIATRIEHTPEALQKGLLPSEFVTLSIKVNTADKIRMAMIEENFSCVNDFIKDMVDQRLESQAETRDMNDPDRLCAFCAEVFTWAAGAFYERAVSQARELNFLYPEVAKKYGLDKYC